MGMQNLQEDLADALRMHFAVYGGDNLIHIKNLDDLDVLASQYGEALRQRSGWLEEVIQESPIAQLEMAVPNPMVSAAQTMGLDTYATLLQFRDRMSDAIQNGAGVRMRLGASLEQIETSGTLLTQEDLLGYGIRVDGAGDPLNVAGVIHSEINEGLKTTFHIMPGGRIYAVQTPTGPKGLRNAYHAAIGSALHRELGLATDNIALEFADTGVPVVLREIEPVAKWNDEFQISMHTEGVAGRTLALDVDGNVRALTPDEWRTRQSLRAQTVIDSSTGEILRREPRVTRAVNSDVELMESLIFDLLTGSPNPYGRGMTNYRLTRYGSYSRAGFGGSFDELTPPARGVGEPPVTPDGPPAITRKARRAELEQLPRNKLREIGEALAAAAGEKRPSPKKKPKWIGYILRREFRDTAPATPAAALPDRPIAAEEAAELDLSKVVLKEELKPKKPTPRQASYVRVVEEVLAALNKWETLGLKAGGKREMGKVGKRAWADALNEAHPELFGQSELLAPREWSSLGGVEAQRSGLLTGILRE